ncbi:MAG: hypothetical protein ACYS1C_12025 [Planctomycetota bacterium]
MGLWLFRALFVLASAGTAYSIGLDLERPFAFLLIGIIASFLVIIAEWYVSRAPIALVSSIVFGALLGMLFATLAASVVGLAIQKETMDIIREDLTGALIVIFTYLGIAFIYQSRDRFNLVVPYVEFRREEKGLKPVVIDTSVIIDGRVSDILKTGVLDGPLLVPQLVLGELHSLADSSDKLKRERGRLGLELLNTLKDDPSVDVSIQDMAGDQDQPVINLNELANALKPVALPDEKLAVKLIKRGEQPGQAVGYLPDGTMVIVEEADHLIGQETEVIVRNTITRETGRMIFARTLSDVRSR